MRHLLPSFEEDRKSYTMTACFVLMQQYARTVLVRIFRRQQKVASTWPGYSLEIALALLRDDSPIPSP